MTEMAIPVDVGPPSFIKIMTPTNVYMDLICKVCQTALTVSAHH